MKMIRLVELYQITKMSITDINLNLLIVERKCINNFVKYNSKVIYEIGD